MHLDEARDLVKLQCAAGIDPTLSDEEVGGILLATARWTVWQPRTAYQHGQVVIPTVRNGHSYRAIVNQQYSGSPPGVSAAVEPIWPLFSMPDSKVGVTRPYWAGYDQQSGNYSLSMVTDGTIVWQDAGPDSPDPWDIRLATYNAWLVKAGKASARFRNTISNMRNDAQMIFEHCMTMAQRYAPTSIA